MSELKLTADEQLEQALIYIDFLQESIEELREALKEIIIIAKFGKSIGIGDYFYNIESTIDRANKLIQPCNEENRST